jgi:diguanylate cyclase (GGDEF)-like protein
MTVALLALSAALAVLLGVVGWLVATRKRPQAAGRQTAEVVARLNERMEEMARELALALERAEEEARRNRVLAELAGSIDLDEVLSKTLEAAAALPGADAALVSLPGENGKATVATLGLPVEDAERYTVSGPPDGRAVRAVTIAYGYPPGDPGANGSVIHGGLAVPLPGDPEPLGFLAVFTRDEGRTFGAGDVDELEALALRATPALDNARRFREARQLADFDALTGLHNRRYFHETLAREVARAHRYSRRLALVVLDLDDFKAINDRVGHLAGDSVLAEAAERVLQVVRSADVACRVGGDEFAVLLPESSFEDADQLYRRLQAAMAAAPIGQTGRLMLSAGVAELRPDDDAAAFFQRADDALYRAKDRGKAQIVAASQTAS